MNVGFRWNYIYKENGIALGMTCHSATSSTTNLVWNCLQSNPGLHDERAVTDHISHGTVVEGQN